MATKKSASKKVTTKKERRLSVSKAASKKQVEVQKNVVTKPTSKERSKQQDSKKRAEIQKNVASEKRQIVLTGTTAAFGDVTGIENKDDLNAHLCDGERPPGCVCRQVHKPGLIVWRWVVAEPSDNLVEGDNSRGIRGPEGNRNRPRCIGERPPGCVCRLVHEDGGFKWEWVVDDPPSQFK